jgi:prophage endopeptidase
MIGALVKRYWLQLLVVALIGVLAFFVNHYRDNAITYKDQRDKATVRAETSEAITNNVITTMNLIRDISQAARMQRTNWPKRRDAHCLHQAGA